MMGTHNAIYVPKLTAFYKLKKSAKGLKNVENQDFLMWCRTEIMTYFSYLKKRQYHFWKERIKDKLDLTLNYYQ